MAVTLSLFAGAGAQFLDNNGNPLSGGKIYTYQAGTTTPLTTYTTNSGTIAHTNPIVLDAAGRVPNGGEIWLTLGIGYKFVVKTSTEVLIATYDNIPSSAQPPAANDADSIMYEQGYTVTAGNFVIGKMYRIATLGTTDFTLIGAVNNVVGTHFIATGVGTGTGTAKLSQTVEAKLAQTVSVKDFGAVGDGVTDDTLAIRAAVATGRRVFFPQGDYRVTGEIEITTPGQIIEFENTGGYGYGEDIGLQWQPNTRIIAAGTFAKRIRTRRLYRASAGDPQDAPLSVVLNIQAEGVVLRNVCVWLNCDYTDNSPTNFGDDCDVGIFVGTRPGVQMHDIQVIGYFRRVGVLFDVTGGTGLPRFNSLAGTPYPDGTVKNGADGCHMYNPYIRGARIGLGALGALPKAGETTYTTDYYDELLGSAVPDRRGSFGFSDFAVFGGRIYGPDHHSNRRLKDPVLDGGVLNETSMNAEPDDAPAAVYLSGLAGNASGNIWGMRFYGTRIATFEAFRCRLNFVSRVAFYSAHIEGRDGGRFDTTGNSIDTNNYVTTSYGDVAATARVDRVRMIGAVRQSLTDGAAPHYYGNSFTLETDSGRYFLDSTAGYVQAHRGDLDLRTSATGQVLLRQGNSTIARFDDTGLLLAGTQQGVRSSSGALDLRSAAGQTILMRVGTGTRAILTDTDFRLANITLNFGNGTSFPTIRIGAGSPEGVVTARIGSLYLRTDGGPGTSLYVKESGTGNTGWVAK